MRSPGAVGALNCIAQIHRARELHAALLSQDGGEFRARVAIPEIKD